MLIVHMLRVCNQLGILRVVGGVVRYSVAVSITWKPTSIM